MDTLTTRGISISVETEYWPPYSQPARAHYVFAYRIFIQNTGNQPVQLTRRYWRVTSGSGDVRLVDGPGVIGETPTLQPGEAYDYTSWCQLQTPVGCMEGYYTMESRESKECFPVFVPKFTLAAPWKLN